MNVCRLSILALVFLATNSRSVADLWIVRPGGATRSTILHFNERNGRFMGTLSADTEGFYGLTLGPGRQVYATANTLGYGDVCHFTPDGDLVARLAKANLRTPGELAFGPDGNLYVIGSTWPESPVQGQVLRFSAETGAFIDYFVPAGSGGAGTLTDLAFGRDRHLYVADFNQGILRYNSTTGEFMGVFVPAGRGGLNSVTAFAFGPDGHLYVCNRDSNAILKFNSRNGAFMKAFVPSNRGRLSAPAGLAFSRDGCLYVSSSGNNRILKYNALTGQFVGALITSHPEVVNPGKLLIAPTPVKRAG